MSQKWALSDFPDQLVCWMAKELIKVDGEEVSCRWMLRFLRNWGIWCKIRHVTFDC